VIRQKNGADTLYTQHTSRSSGDLLLTNEELPRVASRRRIQVKNRLGDELPCNCPACCINRGFKTVATSLQLPATAVPRGIRSDLGVAPSSVLLRRLKPRSRPPRR